MVDLRVRLPKDEAATINAALAAASDQFGSPPSNPRASADPNATPPYSQVDALLDVAPSFLTTGPQDRSGEDRPLVVVHVDADLLADPPALENVPAGTSPPARGKVCHLQGLGGIEPDTARRLACDATLLGAITTHDGEVLDLGRTRRSVSKAQRRALLIRDRTCQYPGCPSSGTSTPTTSSAGRLGARPTWTICCCSAGSITRRSTKADSASNAPRTPACSEPAGGGSCCPTAPRPGPGGTPTPCKINWPNRPAARPQRCPGWTGSIIPTLARSDPGGPANPSTSTNASTPSSP